MACVIDRDGGRTATEWTSFGDEAQFKDIGTRGNFISIGGFLWGEWKLAAHATFGKQRSGKIFGSFPLLCYGSVNRKSEKWFLPR